MDWTTRILIQEYVHGGEHGPPRLVLADRLDEVGRTIEARFLRLTQSYPVHLR